MAVKFKMSNCTAVGTFNIYVIQPHLLKEIGLLPDGELVKFETNLTQPGFRFSSVGLNATWTVRPDRLTVETTDPRKDCGADLACVLEALKWTPITAVGINVEYESAEWPASVAVDVPNELREKLLESDYSVEQTTYHLHLKFGNQKLNLQWSKFADLKTLSCNIHHDVPNNDGQRVANEFCLKMFAETRTSQQRLESFLRTNFAIEIESHEHHRDIQQQINISRDSA